jgi:prepilin-type N-terminal cleavage/methylation domain-containing protein
MQIANCKLQIENYRSCAVARAGVAPTTPQLQICNLRFAICNLRSSRRGVTLVELLITITIISILAGLILGIASLAGEKARENQTRHVIQRMHQLLMEHYDSYRERRVRINPAIEQFVNNPKVFVTSSNANRGVALAQARLFALREMMLMEVPDRWSDVLLQPTHQYLPSATVVQPVYLNARTDLSNVYFRRFQSLWLRNNSLTGVQNTLEEIVDNQSAECLYLVITLATGDGEARGLFAENSIGDTDGDGAPEFLDGWGNPIEFLRWAPGFDSLVQLNANTLLAMNDDARRAEIAKDHDSFDMFRVEASAYRLMPLIYSLGPDEESSVYTGLESDDVSEHYVLWKKKTFLKINPGAEFKLQPVLTPYDIQNFNTDLDYFLGTDLSTVEPSNYEATATDNIHNHLLGLRGRP